ncbi:MAG: Ldh family oxidoreductase, partial [Chitinophagaceae bacterium]
PADEFKQHMDHWIQGFRTARPIPGEEKVLVPGDPEREFEAERRKNGIILVQSIIDDLQLLAEKFDIKKL